MGPSRGIPGSGPVPAGSAAATASFPAPRNLALTARTSIRPAPAHSPMPSCPQERDEYSGYAAIASSPGTRKRNTDSGLPNRLRLRSDSELPKFTNSSSESADPSRDRPIVDMELPASPRACRMRRGDFADHGTAGGALASCVIDHDADPRELDECGGAALPITARPAARWRPLSSITTRTPAT